MRRAESTRRSLSIETYLLGPETSLTVLEIDGDDSSTTTTDVAELQLMIEGAAAVEVDIVIADGRSTELER